MSLPVRPDDAPEPRRRNLNVNTARFSTDEPEEIVVPVRWYHGHPGRVVAVVIASLLALLLVWHALHAYPVFRFCAILLGLFWLFAIGIHPVHAAARTVGSWFGDDDA